MGEDISDKDIGKSKDASDVTSDRLRDTSRDSSSSNQAANYASAKQACLNLYGPMTGGGWLSLDDWDNFNSKTKALTSGSADEIEKAIKSNIAGAKSVQLLLPAISAKIAMVARTASVEP